MGTVEAVKQRISELYEQGNKVHMSISLSRPKLVLENVEVRIKNVYPHIFTVEAEERLHTLRYTDVLVGHIRINEL